MDIIPIVNKCADISRLQLLLQATVHNANAAELHVHRGLDDRLSCARQKGGHPLAVARPVLLTHQRERAVRALANENTALAGPDEEGAVSAVVDGYLGDVVEYVDVAILEALYYELHAVYGAGHLVNELAMLVLDCEVFGVDCFALVPRVDFGRFVNHFQAHISVLAASATKEVKRTKERKDAAHFLF